MLEGTEVRREEIGSGRAPWGRSMRTERKREHGGGREAANKWKDAESKEGSRQGGKNH